MNQVTKQTFMDALRAADREGWRLTAGDLGNAVLLAVVGSALIALAIMVGGQV